MRGKTTFSGACSALAAGTLLLLSGAVAAQPAEPGGPGQPFNGAAQFHAAQQGGVSLDQAVAIAKRRYAGRVVRAVTTMRNGRVVHEVRILGDDGRVRTVHVDAQSGEVR